MKRLILLAMMLGLALPAMAADQQPTAEQKKMMEMMEKAQKLGSPGENHKALEPLVGTWEVTGQWWMGPNDKPQEMKGKATSEWILGGRFVQQKYSAEPMNGMPAFEGLGLTGYDNIKKTYVSLWLDSMSTGIMQGSAKYDAASKTFNESGTFSCPMTNDIARPFTSTWKVASPDHIILEMNSKSPEGKDFKMMELHYTRAKG